MIGSPRSRFVETNSYEPTQPEPRICQIPRSASIGINPEDDLQDGPSAKRRRIVLPPRASRPTQSLMEIRDQHNVAVQVPAGNCQLLAVVGPVEVPNQFALEVGDLFGRASDQRLLPDVARASTRQCIVKSPPIN